MMKLISFAEVPRGESEDASNKADTPATIDEILAHNAAWLALCPD